MSAMLLQYMADGVTDGPPRAAADHAAQLLHPAAAEGDGGGEADPRDDGGADC